MLKRYKFLNMLNIFRRHLKVVLYMKSGNKITFKVPCEDDAVTYTKNAEGGYDRVTYRKITGFMVTFDIRELEGIVVK